MSHVATPETFYSLPHFVETEFNKVSFPHSCGSFFHNGKLYIFTVQKITPSGKSINLSFDDKRKFELSHALLRLFEAVALDSKNAEKPSLTNALEFNIPLTLREVQYIKTIQDGKEQKLGEHTIEFLKGNNPRKFDFLQDIYKTVFVHSHSSDYLSTLSEKQQEKRKARLDHFDLEETRLDKVLTELRAPNYHHYSSLNSSKAEYWLSLDSLQSITTLLSPEKTKVLSSVKIGEKSQNMSSLKEFEKALDDEQIESIAIPVHTYAPTGFPKAAFGVYIDKKCQELYFYNPSKIAIAKDSPEGQYISKLLEMLYPKDSTKRIKNFWKAKFFESNLRTKKHLDAKARQITRKIKLQLTASENRSSQEKRALADIPASYNSGRYVLKFFETMFQSTNLKSDFKKFLSTSLRREDIEHFSDQTSTSLLQKFYSKYNQYYAHVNVPD